MSCHRGHVTISSQLENGTGSTDRFICWTVAVSLTSNLRFASLFLLHLALESSIHQNEDLDRVPRLRRCRRCGQTGMYNRRSPVRPHQTVPEKCKL
ncbi:hypothetical protein RB195_004979 [Necator americanus]|uniref:Uncharacterized protein n=1 Tax=Necator americanus TaxID=51031 RepID=A0ABR1BKL3_NECAM